MGHGEAIDVINCRFEAERERKVDALRNTRIIMAEIRNLLAKKPKLPHEWLKLPGDENLKPEEEPEPAPPEASREAALSVARALFAVLGLSLIHI